MTVPELYERMRVDALESSNTWDDLDWASGFCDQAVDAIKESSCRGAHCRNLYK